MHKKAGKGDKQANKSVSNIFVFYLESQPSLIYIRPHLGGSVDIGGFFFSDFEAQNFLKVQSAVICLSSQLETFS